MLLLHFYKYTEQYHFVNTTLSILFYYIEVKLDDMFVHKVHVKYILN